jgi:hypothetical protein
MVDPANLQGWYDLRKSLKIGIASALKLGYIGTFRNVSMNFGKKKTGKKHKTQWMPITIPQGVSDMGLSEKKRNRKSIVHPLTNRHSFIILHFPRLT